MKNTVRTTTWEKEGQFHAVSRNGTIYDVFHRFCEDGDLIYAVSKRGEKPLSNSSGGYYKLAGLLAVKGLRVVTE